MTAQADGPLRIRPGSTWADLAAPLHAVLTTGGASDVSPGPSAVIVETSGSTGTPKAVRLSAGALRASGEATAEVLGDVSGGQWLLALPTHHVSGLQVLARSVRAGTVPVSLDPSQPFTADAFAAATARMSATHRRYASLVPTQLHRLLADPAGTDALLRLDAVLLGGSAADPALVQRARRAGARVVTTYGMSETCGGCVYDGIPLPGVRVRIGADERIRIGGPVLADGYPTDPQLTGERFVEDDEGRWFVTDDRGVCAGSRLSVLGRVDDVIVTGGQKVEPRDVEARLRELPEIADALVLGVPDPEWGQRVGAIVVAQDPARAPARPTTRQLRERLAPSLPAHALPRQFEFVAGIPMLASGKPDRAWAQEFLAESGRIDLPPTE